MFWNVLLIQKRRSFLDEIWYTAPNSMFGLEPQIFRMCKYDAYVKICNSQTNPFHLSRNAIFPFTPCDCTLLSFYEKPKTNLGSLFASIETTIGYDLKV